MAAGLLAFLIALLASLTLTVPVRAFALRVGMVDRPGPRIVEGLERLAEGIHPGQDRER